MRYRTRSNSENAPVSPSRNPSQKAGSPHSSMIPSIRLWAQTLSSFVSSPPSRPTPYLNFRFFCLRLSITLHGFTVLPDVLLTNQRANARARRPSRAASSSHITESQSQVTGRLKRADCLLLWSLRATSSDGLNVWCKKHKKNQLHLAGVAWFAAWEASPSTAV